MGACTTLQDALLIVMEYADQGDLKKFVYEEQHSVYEKLAVVTKVLLVSPPTL